MELIAASRIKKAEDRSLFQKAMEKIGLATPKNAIVKTLDEAMAREVYEEANAFLQPGYLLFAVLRIECTVQLPGREYPHPYSYMGMYAGLVKGLEPVARDPAGIITGRDLFTSSDCSRRLDEHDQILLREAVTLLKGYPAMTRRIASFL